VECCDSRLKWFVLDAARRDFVRELRHGEDRVTASRLLGVERGGALAKWDRSQECIYLLIASLNVYKVVYGSDRLNEALARVAFVVMFAIAETPEPALRGEL
jgi:hypothetical protein